jgi:hypothetical protein
MARFRGNNLQRHQKPYEKVGKLTDRPPGADPYRGPGDMSELDMDTVGRAESNTTPIRPQSSNSRMAARDNDES